MAIRRSDIFDPEISGVYHCISRCVRKEPLLDTPQRRMWLVERIERLAHGTAIDVIAFAVMSNHVHLLLRNRPDVVASWSDRDVATRRIALLPNRRGRQRNGTDPDAPPSEQEIAALLSSPKLLRRARRELSDLGFFHRLLKEPCARLWNRQDGVTGHFWDGRFLSPPVLDGPSLLRVARYIELNEIRACTAASIPGSLWTSAHRQWKRLRDAMASFLKSSEPRWSPEVLDQIPWEPVFPCGGDAQKNADVVTTEEKQPECSLADYLATLELTGRAPHPAKRGVIRAPRMAVTEAIVSAVRIASPTGRVHMAEAIRTLRRRLRGFAGVEPEACLRDASTVQGNVGPLRPLRGAPLLSHTDKPFGSCHAASRDSIALEALRRGVVRVIPIQLVE